jgi:NADPH2:quinone reductase
MQAIRVHQFGSADVLRGESIPMPEPGQGEARVKIEAAGINFIDVYQRTGQYRGELPFTLGVEGAGVVDKVGPGVTEVKPGDRVAYAMHAGSYAEYAIVSAWKLVSIPNGVSTQQAAAVMLQGMTAH